MSSQRTYSYPTMVLLCFFVAVYDVYGEGDFYVWLELVAVFCFSCGFFGFLFSMPVDTPAHPASSPFWSDFLMGLTPVVKVRISCLTVICKLRFIAHLLELRLIAFLKLFRLNVILKLRLKVPLKLLSMIFVMKLTLTVILEPRFIGILKLILICLTL